MHNFTSNRTISNFSKDLQELTKKMENASKFAIKWFTNKCMIVNPGKFQSFVIEISKGKINPQSLKINRNSIETSESVKLLEIDIDNHLNLESHVSTICKKAVRQLNALSHLNSFLLCYVMWSLFTVGSL